MRRFLVAAICLLAAACSQQALLNKIAAPEDRALAERVIESLRTGDGSALVAATVPAAQAQARLALPQIIALTPRGPAGSVQLADARFTIDNTTGQTRKRTLLAYALDQGQRHVLLSFVILRQGQAAGIMQFNVQPLPKSLDEMQAFSLSGRGPTQYLFLALALASLAICVAALVLLFRTPGVRWRWAWAIGCAFGFGQIGVNWTTGQIAATPTALQFLGAFVLKQGALAPWMVGFGVPIVAVVFLILRPKLRNPGASGRRGGGGSKKKRPGDFVPGRPSPDLSADQ